MKVPPTGLVVPYRVIVYGKFTPPIGISIGLVVKLHVPDTRTPVQLFPVRTAQLQTYPVKPAALVHKTTAPPEKRTAPVVINESVLFAHRIYAAPIAVAPAGIGTKVDI